MDVDLINRPPKRPPLLRSQSDSNPSLTTLAVHKHHEDTISTAKFLEDHLLLTHNDTQHTPITSPHRPPRNPARAIAEQSITLQSPIPSRPTRKFTLKSKRPRTATGTREEVTPWELHPPPDSYREDTQKFQVVGVIASNAEQSVSRRILPSARPSSSSGNGTSLSFPDLNLLRRKSTGSKFQRPKTAHVLQKPRASTAANPSVPQRQVQVGGLMTPRHSPKTPHATPRVPHPPLPPPKDVLETIEDHHIPEGPTLSHSSSSATTSSSFALHKSTSMSSSELKNNLKFSTADRTILEELKRNLQARASQFVNKGGIPGLNMGDIGAASTFNRGKVGGIGGARRHHPYPKDEVPYPRSFDRDVMDLDVWENLFCKQICDSVTWHEFDEPPTKVLDIGCGTGSWILDSARVWRNCHFVGLDVVPLHPDLIQVGSMDMAQRITWVQHNFLEGLPFPNEEFDFVRIKRIARGVPEDKWDILFEEITRVMKPGGAFEMIEEDLFFPGSIDSDDVEEEGRPADSPRRDGSRRSSWRHSTIASSQSPLSSPTRRLSGTGFGSDASDLENEIDSDALTSSAGSVQRHRLSDDVGSYPLILPATSVGSSTGATGKSALNTLASGQGTMPVLGRGVGAIVEDQEGELRADGGLPTPPEEQDNKYRQSNSHSTIRQEGKNVKTPTRRLSRKSSNSELPSFFAGNFVNGLGLAPPAASKRNSPPSAATPFLLRSPLSSSLALGFLDSQTNLAVHLSPNRTAAQLAKHRPSISHPEMTSTETLPIPRHPSDDRTKSGPSSKPISPFLLRQLPRPPINPRDHSLLKMIHNEMHAARFINLSPLSILPNMLSLHFKDVRTHPPLQFTFPPRSNSMGVDLRPDDSAHDPHYVPKPMSPDHIFETQNSARPAPITIVIPQSRVRRHSSAASNQIPSFLSSPEDPDRLSGDEGDEANFLSVQSLIQGTSPYVTLDSSRPSAFSPSSRASFLKSPKSAFGLSLSDTEEDSPNLPGSPGSRSSVGSPSRPTPFSIAASASMLRNSLPNRRLNVDLRSLNLHLWARVAEILACSETMWEWVLEYQKNARNRIPRTQRARSKSVDVPHSRLVAPAQETATDRLQASLMELTREDYDDLLLRFYMDMQDHMDIDAAMEKRFGWSISRASPTPERKSFDDACKRYVLWKQEQGRPAKTSRARPLSASYASTNAALFSSFTSMSQEALDFDGLPTSSDANPSSSALFPQASPTASNDERRRNSVSSSFRSKSPSISLSPEPRRLSRSLRVFVAWKPE
ncbi:hypothetical protein PQX77_004050 [Marasmius sp. AFHP31]|nr:hypothetical protein PQX77_004050 [Marasmius sp. AFHP31]